MKATTLEDVVNKAVEEGIDRSGIRGTVLAAVNTIRCLEVCLALIEDDSHEWQARYCKTCIRVSSLLKRPYGCKALLERSTGT